SAIPRSSVPVSSLRRLAPVVLAVVLGLFWALPVAAATPFVRSTDSAAPGGRFVVLWRDHVPDRLRISGLRAIRPSESGQRSVVTATSGRAGQLAAALRADPRVLGVVPDAVVHATGWPDDAPPSDPLYPDQEDLAQIHVPAVWPVSTGDPSVVVAVVDTGVDLTHPDLAGVTVVAPRNETFNTTDVSDAVGHGRSEERRVG